MHGKNKTIAKGARSVELTELFMKTPEMRQCREMAGTVASKLDPEDTVSITIDVPRQFISLTDFLEHKRAADAGVAPRPAPKVIEQIALNELHGQLHWLVTAPAYFAHFRVLWNRFCDSHGAPEEKIADPGSSPAQASDEGPF